MAILGKDLFDLSGPATRIKVQFGESAYWIESDKKAYPYGEVLVGLLNYDVALLQQTLKELREALAARVDQEAYLALLKVRWLYITMPFYKDHKFELPFQVEAALEFSQFMDELYDHPERIDFMDVIAGDIVMIQDRYTWFLEGAFACDGPQKKKGQRKLPLAEMVYKNCLDAFVSGRSLGGDRRVDAPDVRIQYEILDTGENGRQVVEKIYFDRLADFVYVELMRGLQKGFLPKRCPNCGRWFLQEPGLEFTYCDSPSPQDPERLCRDIGARQSFQDKVKNNEVWRIHQRAYRKYYARVMKKKMTKEEFLAWSTEAERIRDEALSRYDGASPEQRKAIEEEVRQKMNRL